MTDLPPRERHVIPLTSREAARIGERLVISATPNTLSTEYQDHVAVCPGCEEYNHKRPRTERFSPECLFWSKRDAEWEIEDVRVAGTSIMVNGPHGHMDPHQGFAALNNVAIEGDQQIEVIARRVLRGESPDDNSAITFYGNCIGRALDGQVN